MFHVDLACICESHSVPRLRCEGDEQDDDASLTAVDPVLDEYWLMMRDRHPCDQLICKPSIADTAMIHDRLTRLMSERCLHRPP